MTVQRTSVAVLGLGRLGRPIAARLVDAGFPVTGWSGRRRSIAGLTVARDAAGAVAGADVVVVVLFDGAACAAALTEIRSAGALSSHATVLNLSTIAPDDAAALAEQLGERYVHCPVLGSAPAARSGQLTLLLGAPSPAEGAAAVLDALGDVVPCHDVRAASALKLVANGVLADAVISLGHALGRAAAAGVPRELALDVLSGTAVGRLVDSKRAWLTGWEDDVQFSARALRKDVELLAELVPYDAPDRAGLTPPGVTGDADIAAISAALARGPEVIDPASRLSAAPGVDGDPALRTPLIRYARGHATGDAQWFRAAFRPTAHVEGVRDGRFVSWDLDAYCANFSGQPAPDESRRRRTITELRRTGSIARATMLLDHGTDTFTDDFLLVAEGGQWRIANKVYERRPTEVLSESSAAAS